MTLLRALCVPFIFILLCIYALWVRVTESKP